ncbi:MAG: bacillithiol system redox-active protein YtxJ [Chitinophagaceae bacterium]
MNWINFNSEVQLENLVQKSFQVPQVIFKHSTRCGTSRMVLNRLERNQLPTEIDFYFLDVIVYRNISNKIAEQFQIYHESPQLIIIKNGECVFDESHFGINSHVLIQQISSL